MSEGKVIKGAVPVLVMPYDENGTIDDGSLRRQLDFCLEAGSQAIAFGMGSESASLTDAERAQVWTLAARHLGGQVPLIAATVHESREGTIALTRLARECGVDCAMVHPRWSGEQLVALFRDLSARVGLPLMIQDASSNAPVEILLRAVREAPLVTSLKIESMGTPDKIGRVVAGLRELGWLDGSGGRPVTVLGGAQGNLLPEELERGSMGTMPSPAIIDAYRTVCDRYAAGDPAGGSDAYFRLILPVQRAASAAGGQAMLAIHKALLQRAGILSTTYSRIGAALPPAWIMERVYRHVADAGLLISRRLQ